MAGRVIGASENTAAASALARTMAELRRLREERRRRDEARQEREKARQEANVEKTATLPFERRDEFLAATRTEVTPEIEAFIAPSPAEIASRLSDRYYVLNGRVARITSADVERLAHDSGKAGEELLRLIEDNTLSLEQANARAQAELLDIAREGTLNPASGLAQQERMAAQLNLLPGTPAVEPRPAPPSLLEQARAERARVLQPIDAKEAAKKAEEAQDFAERSARARAIREAYSKPLDYSDPAVRTQVAEFEKRILTEVLGIPGFDPPSDLTPQERTLRASAISQTVAPLQAHYATTDSLGRVITPPLSEVIYGLSQSRGDASSFARFMEERGYVTRGEAQETARITVETVGRMYMEGLLEAEGEADLTILENAASAYLESRKPLAEATQVITTPAQGVAELKAIQNAISNLSVTIQSLARGETVNEQAFGGVEGVYAVPKAVLSLPSEQLRRYLVAHVNGLRNYANALHASVSAAPGFGEGSQYAVQGQQIVDAINQNPALTDLAFRPEVAGDDALGISPEAFEAMPLALRMAAVDAAEGSREVQAARALPPDQRTERQQEILDRLDRARGLVEASIGESPLPTADLRAAAQAAGVTLPDDLTQVDLGALQDTLAAAIRAGKVSAGEAARIYRSAARARREATSRAVGGKTLTPAGVKSGQPF